MSGVTHRYRTVGNVWDSLYAKHQLRESNITLDRVYTMLAEFLIELKLHAEQDKITQIVTGSSGTAKHSVYDEYINASKGKIPVKGKGKQGDGKGGKSNWRSACDEYWKSSGCSQGHHCPKYHPRPKGKKVKEKGPSLKENLRARVHRDRLHPDEHSLNLLEETDPNPNPNPKHAHAAESCM